MGTTPSWWSEVPTERLHAAAVAYTGGSMGLDPERVRAAFAFGAAPLSVESTEALARANPIPRDAGYPALRERDAAIWSMREAIEGAAAVGVSALRGDRAEALLALRTVWTSATYATGRARVGPRFSMTEDAGEVRGQLDAEAEARYRALARLT